MYYRGHPCIISLYQVEEGGRGGGRAGRGEGAEVTNRGRTGRSRAARAHCGRALHGATGCQPSHAGARESERGGRGQTAARARRSLLRGQVAATKRPCNSEDPCRRRLGARARVGSVREDGSFPHAPSCIALESPPAPHCSALHCSLSTAAEESARERGRGGLRRAGRVRESPQVAHGWTPDS